ncbi:MAG: IS110 family transposase [Pseudonocardiaceae bacterium]
MEVIVDRCAGLDVHKDTVMACVRGWAPADRRRVEEVREFRTFTSSLRQLGDWLAAEGVSEVVMEATGVLWRPVWAVLEDLDGVELLLVNAQHVHNLPGRKTDVKDACWLAQLLECGLLRGSFVPPPQIAQLRDLTRYQTKLVQERAREIQRVQKQLEIAGIKLDSVASDVMGKSARKMIDALIAGEGDVEVLADLAMARLRNKIGDLRLALEGRVDEHRRLMLSMHLHHIDELTATIDRLEEQIDKVIAPFAEQRDRLCTIPGIGPRISARIIAEIGVDMTRFPTARHLASWAGLCPGNHESAHKRRSGKARKGDQALRTAMCEAAWLAARTPNTYLAAQYRRFRQRMGRGNEAKANFAVAHTLIDIVWHVLHDNVDYIELGADHFQQRRNTVADTRRLVTQLERLGHHVTLTPAA